MWNENTDTLPMAYIYGLKYLQAKCKGMQKPYTTTTLVPTPQYTLSRLTKTALRLPRLIRLDSTQLGSLLIAC